MNDTAFRVPFRRVIQRAIGGGWGKEEPEDGLLEVRVIRGTDFARIAELAFRDVPRRYEAASKVPQRTLEEGDIVLEISGGSRTAGQSTGRTLLVTQRLLDSLPPLAIPASFCRLLRVDRNKIDPQYAYYALQDMYASDRAAQYEQQSTGISNFQFEYFLDAEHVRLPGKHAQRAIAAVLGALDDKIEQNRRTARVLERLARAIFRAWFVDFEPVKVKAAGAVGFPSMPQEVFDALPTRFVDSEIGPVPEGWAVKAIGDVVTLKGGGTPSTKNPQYWEGGTRYWATPKDMSRLSHPILLDTERRITDAGVNCVSSGILPVGTVLMSSRAPVGYLAITDVPTAINQGFIAMICDGTVPPIYVLNWAFTSMETIKAHASGTTFAEISKKNFRPLPVVESVGKEIVAYQQLAEPLFELLTACVRENERLAGMRDYLLPRLLRGSVRVKTADG